MLDDKKVRGMTQQDTKITTLVDVPNENCNGCCFDFGDG